MTTALRSQLFGMGKMPAELKNASASSEVLMASEGVSVRQSVRSLKLARASVSEGTKLLIGAAVLLPSRALLSVGAHMIVDADIHADGREATLSFAADGLRLAFDVEHVTREGSGAVSLHYRVSVPAPALAELPTSCAVAVNAAGPALLNGWKGTRA